jgi:hypothetical protein
MTYQPRSLLCWTMPLAILQTLLKSEHLWMSMLVHFLKIYFVPSCCIFVYNKQTKVWGNSNFKAYYLLLDIMGMVRVLDRSHRTIKDYWHSSNILNSINNINTAWEEVSVKCLKGVWASFCEHRNINICCSSIPIYTYKLQLHN